MKTTQSYLSKRKRYQRKMDNIKKTLPRNWVKQIMERRKRITLANYNKLYNDLVNIVNGRSYRTYLKRKDLVREIIELSNQNKNNES